MAETPQTEPTKDSAASAPSSAPAPTAPAPTAAAAKPPEAAAEAASEQSAAKKALGSTLEKLKTILSGIGGALGFIPRALLGAVRGVFAAPLLLIKGDAVEKILSAGFFASVLLAGYTSVQIYRYLVKKWHLDQPAVQAPSSRKDYLSTQKDLAKLAANLFMLEKFSASLDSNASNVRSYEFELFVECDSAETSEFLKVKLQAIRDGIGGKIQNRKYEELLTEAGKERLKADILGVINGKLREAGSKGQVKRVYFSRFVMG